MLEPDGAGPGPVAKPSTAAAPSPLLGLVLTLTGDGATTADLEDRLAGIGLQPRAGLVEGILEEASTLGLVRVAVVERTGPRRTLTTLGQRLVDGDLRAEEAGQLRELESLRTDLTATIAHELRTPLTAIRTCAGLLLDDDRRPTPEQHRTLVETIERNAERMTRLVGDILDLTRFRAGTITLQLRRFDPAELARTSTATLAPVARDRQVEIAVVEDEPVRPVYADHRRIEAALVNLVSNAVRFSPAGGQVTVAVTTGHGEARWSVRDDGPGISPDDQARLFERFFVARSDRGGPRDGVGLGLPTAQAIAQAHGGRIDVQSIPGDGSTFTLVVPLDGPANVSEVD